MRLHSRLVLLFFLFYLLILTMQFICIVVQFIRHVVQSNAKRYGSTIVPYSFHDLLFETSIFFQFLKPRPYRSYKLLSAVDDIFYRKYENTFIKPSSHNIVQIIQLSCTNNCFKISYVLLRSYSCSDFYQTVE